MRLLMLENGVRSDWNDIHISYHFADSVIFDIDCIVESKIVRAIEADIRFLIAQAFHCRAYVTSMAAIEEGEKCGTESRAA